MIQNTEAQQLNIKTSSENKIDNFSESTKSIEDIYKIEQQDDFVTNLGTGGLGTIIGAGVGAIFGGAIGQIVGGALGTAVGAALGEGVHPIKTSSTVIENPNHYYAMGTGVGIGEKPTQSCSSYNGWSSC